MPGFFRALRCSEFTGADCGVLLGDIAFMHDEKLDRNYVLLNLRVSKTDPYRLGCKIFLYETGYTLCPYQSLLLYCKLRGISSGARSHDLFSQKALTISRDHRGGAVPCNLTRTRMMHD